MHARAPGTHKQPPRRVGHPKTLTQHGTGSSSARRAARRRVRACPTARPPHAGQTRQLGRAARPPQHWERRRLGGGCGKVPTRSAEGDGGGGERCGLSPAALRPRGHRGAWPWIAGLARVPPPPSARALTTPAGARSPGTIGHARVSRRSPPVPRSRAPSPPSPPPPHSPPLTSGPRPSGVAPLRPCHVIHQPIAGCARPAGSSARA